jgi:protein-S-isoprenylcysteine O-methyltransferase Ste14
MLSLLCLGELLLCWILWVLAFVKPSQEASGQKKVVRATSSRWGIGLVTLAFAMAWIYLRPVGYHKSVIELVASMVIGPPSVVLAWAAAHQLGKQWRYEAALSEDHELIQSGPYQLVRHPIYTSMLGMYVSTGLAYTWWPMFVGGLIAFIAGTEIRIQAEERLLTERFPEAYPEFRERVKGYIPFVR